MSSTNNSTASRSPALAAVKTKTINLDATTEAHDTGAIHDQTASTDKDVTSGVSNDITHTMATSSDPAIEQTSEATAGYHASDEAPADSTTLSNSTGVVGDSTSPDANNESPLDPTVKAPQPNKTKLKNTKRKNSGRKTAAKNTTTATTANTAGDATSSTMQAAGAASSNKQPQTKKTSTLDEELLKKIDSELRKPAKWGTQVEPLKEAEMRDDFKDMGFSSNKIKEMMKTRELIKVDGTTQRPFSGGGMCVAGTGPEPAKRARKPTARGQQKYEPLPIYDEENWVLFDPLKGFPASCGEPPAAISQWATFQPDNKRVLLYNTATESVRTQVVPECLKGKIVTYTPTGPKVTGFKPVKSTKKKPAAEAPAAEAQDAPVLGRGARRKTRDLPSSDANKSSPASKEAAAPPPVASKKRKADLISSDPATTSSPASKEATELLPAAKKLKSSSPPAAEEEAAPASKKRKRTSLPVAEEEDEEPKEKKKRRAGRPKMTPKMVEESSSEGKK